MENLAQLGHHPLELTVLQEIAHLDHLAGQNPSWSGNLQVVMYSMGKSTADDHEGLQRHAHPSLENVLIHILAATTFGAAAMHLWNLNRGLLHGPETCYRLPQGTDLEQLSQTLADEQLVLQWSTSAHTHLDFLKLAFPKIESLFPKTVE